MVILWDKTIDNCIHWHPKSFLNHWIAECLRPCAVAEEEGWPLRYGLLAFWGLDCSQELSFSNFQDYRIWTIFQYRMRTHSTSVNSSEHLRLVPRCPGLEPMPVDHPVPLGKMARPTNSRQMRISGISRPSSGWRRYETSGFFSERFPERCQPFSGWDVSGSTPKHIGICGFLPLRPGLVQVFHTAQKKKVGFDHDLTM